MVGNVILFLNMLSYFQGDYSLNIDIFRYIQEENVLILDVTFSNKTKKRIHVNKYEPYRNNCFRSYTFWDLELYKDGIRYYTPLMLTKRELETIVVKKQSKYSFQISVCLSELNRDSYIMAEVPKSGEYQIQLLTKFPSLKPNNIEIKSNVISLIVD